MTPDPLPEVLRPLSDLELAVGLVACCAALALLSPPPTLAMGKRPTAPAAASAPAAAASLPAFSAGNGECAFDSHAALGLARTRYPAEVARCRIVFVGNTLDGKPWPAKSWPSSAIPAQKATP